MLGVALVGVVRGGLVDVHGLVISFVVIRGEGLRGASFELDFFHTCGAIFEPRKRVGAKSGTSPAHEVIAGAPWY